MWLQATEHEDDSDTTFSLACVFIASPSSSQCACAFVCVGTWPCSAATFGAQLWIYPLTQNTDNMSNLFPLSGSLSCLRQSLWSPENGKLPANANPDNITGAKNTFSNDTYCTPKHLKWTTPLPAQKVIFTFQTTHKPLCNVLQIQMILQSSRNLKLTV